MAQLWNPVAVATDQVGDLFIADSGDQSILELPVSSGSDYGTSIAAGGIAAIVGEGGNGPYLADGMPALGQTAELNDPEGIAVSAAGTLFITDGSQHCIRAVPNSTSTVLGRSMQGGDLYTLAGALPVSNSTGLGNGTRLAYSRACARPDGHHGVDVRHGSFQRPQYAAGAGDRVNPFDRRTFLATGVRTSAAVAVAGVLARTRERGGGRQPHSVRSEHRPRRRAWWRRISR